jgi:hypothetical protein
VGWWCFDLPSKPELTPPAMFTGHINAARTTVLCYRDILLVAGCAHETGTTADHTLAL